MSLVTALAQRLMALERRVDDLVRPEVGRPPVWLAARLTSGSWDGDAKTTGDNGTIDLSAVFGAPAGIKAAHVRMIISDETVGVWASCGPSNGEWNVTQYTQVASQRIAVSGWVTCDANGDIYWACSGELDEVWLEITAYWPS